MRKQPDVGRNPTRHGLTDPQVSQLLRLGYTGDVSSLTEDEAERLVRKLMAQREGEKRASAGQIRKLRRLGASGNLSRLTSAEAEARIASLANRVPDFLEEDLGAERETGKRFSPYFTRRWGKHR